MTIIKVITLTINYNITGDKVRYHKNSQKNNKNRKSQNKTIQTTTKDIEKIEKGAGALRRFNIILNLT